MDVSDPTRSITPSLDGPVLAVLAAAGRPLTVGEIAQLSVRGSEIGIRKCLGRLVQQGVIRAAEMGRNRVHELNREHVAAGIAIALANLRLEVIKRLRDELGSWNPRPVAAWLFGSTARADGDERSDIDLLVVRGIRRGETLAIFDAPPTGVLGVIAEVFGAYASAKNQESNPWLTPGAEDAWREQLDRLRRLVPSWTGNQAQIIELTINEMLNQRRNGATLFEEIDRDGISLMKQPLPLLQHPKK